LTRHCVKATLAPFSLETIEYAAVEHDALGFDSACEDLDDEGMKVREVGGDDGKVLGNLIAECSAPVRVGEVGDKRIAVEKGQLSGDGSNNAITR
jgi:hypothetical protein